MFFEYIRANKLECSRCLNCALHTSAQYHIYYFAKGTGEFFFMGNYEDITANRLFYIIPGTPYSIKCFEPDVKCFHVAFQINANGPDFIWKYPLFTVPAVEKRKDLENIFIRLSVASLVENTALAERIIERLFECIDYSTQSYSIDLATRNFGRELKNIPKHTHIDEYQIDFFKSGSGLILINDKWISYADGSLCFIPPSIPHEIIFNKDCNIDNYSIKCKVLKHKNIKIPASGFALQLNTQYASMIQKIMMNIAGEFIMGETIDDGLLDQLFSIISMVNKDTDNQEKSSIVDSAVDYIKTKYSDKDLRLINISDALDVSPEHLSRVFHSQTGITLSTYITKCRLNHGLLMLKNSDLPIKEIADKCGFSNVSYFASQIKKFYKMTPKEIRNSSQRTVNR